MDIQKARFTDRLRFFMEIDECCLDWKIPSLTLQPIIENAVIHAVEPNEDGGTIWARVIDERDTVLIEIEDDGIGIHKDKINLLLTEDSQLVENKSKGIGIGFSNVVKRLRLFYGEEDVITIKSEIGSGTKVIIQIKK